MITLYILLGSFGVICLVLKWRYTSIDFNLAGRISMALMLCFTASGHFMFPVGMAAMLPSFVPMKVEIVWVTGVLEIVFGIGLMSRDLYKVVGWVLMVFLIMILPANIYAAMHSINYMTGELTGPGLNYLWFRIPLQLLFIGWVYALVSGRWVLRSKAQISSGDAHSY